MATVYLTPGVYVEEVDRGSKPIEGVGTAVAAFVGFTEKLPDNDPNPYAPHLITSWSQFVKSYGEPVKGGFLGQAVYGYFNNGGSVCYVSGLPGEIGTDGQATGTNGKAPQLPAPVVGLPSRSQPELPTLEFTAREASAGSGEIHVEVRPADEGAPEDQFTVLVRRGEVEESFSNVTLGKGRGQRNVADVINRESRLVRVAEKDVAGSLTERMPAVGTFSLARVEPVPLAERPARLPALESTVFTGVPADRTGIGGLEAVDTVTMLCLPDLMAAHMQGRITDDDVRVVQRAMLDHCENMGDRVAILDTPLGLSPQAVETWVKNGPYDSKYGALYYPWIQVGNPDGGTMLVPPSGHMAGIWARNDSERGVHKAPANEPVRGAIGLEVQVSKGEQSVLNPAGINCIRSFPGRGIRVWGARTLSSDPSWRYLNVRRLFNFVEKSIEEGTQWVVFEPNDLDLWERIKRDVSAFLLRLWRDGALFGATSGEAFFVKCDEELNPPEVRDVGQVIVEIGIAPVKPAEFVIFRISQYTPGAEA